MAKINLYLNTADKSYTIVDDKDKKYSVEEARGIVESDQLGDCNVAFQRLFNQCNGDTEELKKYYAVVDRKL